MRRLGLLVMSLFAWQLAVAPWASADEIVLSTDAEGAMFAAGQLSSSYVSTRCLNVQWRQNAVPRALGVSANVSGGLAPYLNLQVEIGAGGGYASCADFTGQVIYQGTLESFGAAHPNSAAQLTAKQITAVAGSVSFRITVSVQAVNEAQSRTASAAFIFAALDEGRLPVIPTPPTTSVSPSPEPTPKPTPVRPSPPPASPQPSTSPEPSTPPEPSTSPQPSSLPGGPDRTEPSPEPAGDPREGTDPLKPSVVASTDGNAGTPRVDDGTEAGPQVTVPLTPRSEPTREKKGPLAGLLSVVDGAAKMAKQAAVVVQQAAAPVAKGVAWGAWSLPLLLLFVVLQNNIDARDPKLAEAPAFADPSLPFDDRYDAPAGADEVLP